MTNNSVLNLRLPKELKEKLQEHCLSIETDISEFLRNLILEKIGEDMWLAKIENTKQAVGRAVIDLATGEILRIMDEGDKVVSKKSTISDYHTLTKEDMLEFDEDKIKHIYHTLKLNKQLDDYGKIKLSGMFIDLKLFKMVLEFDENLSKDIMKLINLVSCRNFIKKEYNSNQECNSFADLWKALDITNNRRKIISMRDFLVKNDIVRIRKKISCDENVLIVNPTIIRQGAFASSISVGTFKDYALEKMDKYATYLLYANGLIEYGDLK